MRRTQPALGHALQRLAHLPHLHHVVARRIDIAEGGEDIHVLLVARHPHVEHDVAGDFGIFGKRRRLERRAARDFAGARGRRRAVAYRRRLIQRLGHQFALGILGIGRGLFINAQIHFGVLRARNRPLVLEAKRRAFGAAGADFEFHRRLVHESGVDAFQPVIQEAQLIDAAFLRVKRVEMRAAVDTQFLVLRLGAQIRLGVASEMHAEAAPVAGGEQRHLDLVPARAGHAPVLGIEIIAHEMPQHIVVERIGVIGARLIQQIPRGIAVVPTGDKAKREDTAVIALIAILVGAAFPRNNAFQRRRLLTGDFPLKRRQIRNAAGADVAVAPLLLRHPLDAVVGIERLLIRTRLRFAGRFARTACIHPQHGVTARAPPFGIHRFPVHVGIRFFFQIGRRHPQLVFLIRPQRHDHREFFRGTRCTFRPENIHAQLRAVAQRYPHVFLDDHFVVFGLGHFALGDCCCHFQFPFELKVRNTFYSRPN